MIETLTEGWVTFIRIPCKEGFIDRWTGDVANDPNSETKSRISLNSTATYYRKDGKGRWLNHFDFTWDMLEWLGISHYCTSDEIWNNCLRALQK